MANSHSTNFSAATKKTNGADTNLLHAKAVVERVANQGIDLTDDYDQWVRLCFSLASLGEEGRPLFHRISCLSGKYDYDDCDQKFSNCLQTSRNSMGLGTFFHIAKDAGIDVSMPAELRPKRGRPKKHQHADGADEARDERTTFHLAEEKLTEMAEFRYNEITHKTEVLSRDIEGKHLGEWQPMDDRTLNLFFVNIRKEDISITKDNLNAIIENSQTSISYNPFSDYYSTLPEWDGQHDYISDIFSVFQFKNETEKQFLMPYLKKWFVTMTALWCELTDDNQLMPVLVGPPRAGKTYFCNHLLPPALRQYAKTINPNENIDKDFQIAISEKGLLIMDELKISSRTAGAMRSTITSTSSDVRAPYARYSEHRQRHASFIGSCNDFQYITESDGNRRYLSVSIEGTNEFTDDTLPHDQAYAQAWYLANHCFDEYRLTSDDARRIEKYNEEYTVPDLCEQLIAANYRVPQRNEQGKALSFSEIINKLKWMNNSSEINPKNVSAALRNLGFSPKRNRKCTRWYVIEITPSESQMEAVNEGHNMFLEENPDGNITT